MASQGAVSVALTQSGILAFANATGPALQKRLGTLSIPDPSKISYDIPSLGEATQATITIKGGKFTATNISFNNLHQDSDGVFMSDAVLTGHLYFADWYEEDKTTISSAVGFPSTRTSHFNSPQFRITFQFIKMTIRTKLELDEHYNLTPKVQETKVTDKKFTYRLPSQTALTSSVYGCVNKKVRDEITDKINAMADDIGSAFRDVFSDVPTDISDSGNLTDDIKVVFSSVPGGLEFPNNNGLKYKAVGTVQWKGLDAPICSAHDVPFPPLSTDEHDALFYVSKYEFSSLYWALYKDGSLNFSFTKDNAASGSKSAFDTNSYPSVPGISGQYPNRNIMVDLELTEVPVVELTEKEATLTYSGTLTYWLTKEGSLSEKDPQSADLFKVALKETDTLESFAVATNSQHLQLLKCNVSTVKDQSLVVTSSRIEITPGMFVKNWRTVLRPVYIDILGKAAQVPLPSTLHGFYTNSKVNLHSSYVSVAVNVVEKGKYESVLMQHGVTISELTEPHENLAVL